MQQAQRFAASLTPVPTAARVTRARGALRWRVISTLISMAILGVLWWMFGRDWSTGWTIAIFSIWILSSAFWLVLSAVALSRAKKDLGNIPEGVAFFLDPAGIEFVNPVPAKVAWPDVSAVKLAGRNFGAGPDLVVESGGQQVGRVPLSFLDTTPASIDSAVQSHSLGRVQLDTSALDKLL